MTANLVNPYSRNMFGPTFLKSSVIAARSRGRGAGAAPLQKNSPSNDNLSVTTLYALLACQTSIMFAPKSDNYSFYCP
jgi:hypothetical protein